MEFSVKEAPGTTTVVFAGSIDGRIGDTLASLRDQVKSRTIYFDCGGITRINSLGIAAWLKALTHFDDFKYSFLDCTEQFLDAAIMIPQFPGKGWIESINILYCCDGCRFNVQKKFTAVGGAMPVIDPPSQCPTCTEPLEMDADLLTVLETLESRNSFKAR